VEKVGIMEQGGNEAKRGPRRMSEKETGLCCRKGAALAEDEEAPASRKLKEGGL